MKSSSYLRAAADIILPRRCLVCGVSLRVNERHLCLECLADMPRTFFWTCPHNSMADKFNERIQEDLDNHGCPSREYYAYAVALFFFHSEAGYRKIPYQIKYNSNLAAGKYFGYMLGKYLKSSLVYEDIDAVVPVPLHWTRRWRRGYNQAAVIAGAVASVIGAPIYPEMLVRNRRTRTQTKLNIKDKSENVSGAFEINPSIMRAVDDISSLRHILIVDDVFTTGSTMYSCFVALRSVFPISVRISIATLGFVGH